MTRLEMEAVINSGGTVLWNGKIHYTIEELPTQEEIDALIAPPSVGPEGLSAYEIAVEEGFVGTVEQWLDSLEGATGPEGPQGPQGEPGEGTGDVIGPASSTDSNVALFDGITGKLLKEGPAIADLATDSDLSSGLATKQDALGFTPVPNTRTVNTHPLSADVTVTKGDVGLGNVDNTSDAALKASLTKSDVGLSNVDNTSDTNKPVSTAQQTAIDGKVDDTAYDATTWNGVTTVAPSKNAIRDKIESLGLGGLTADIQTFDSSGTWTKPANAKMVYAIVWGAGSGGTGGGRDAAGTSRIGGPGGAGGGVVWRLLRANLLNSTETVTVGTGGTGGAGKTSNGAGVGTAGGAGGASSFGTWVKATGGLAPSSSTGGVGGNEDLGLGYSGSFLAVLTTFLGIQRGGSGGNTVSGDGGLGGNLSLDFPTIQPIAPGGGGGGGGINSANSNNFTKPGTGASATVAGVTEGGTNGVAGTDNSAVPFNGGGGGSSNPSGVGFAGGNAGTAAGGGGGGAGAAANGGAGGNGGNGLVIVISW